MLRDRSGSAPAAKPKATKKIIALAAGLQHTAALYEDGTVRAVGSNSFGQLRVEEWTDIRAIACGDRFTVGLGHDGSVRVAGYQADGQDNVRYWTGITAIDACEGHIAGVDREGHIFFAGGNPDYRFEKPYWYWYGQIATKLALGSDYLAALTSDGQVLVHGRNLKRFGEVKNWRDITAIAAGAGIIAGLTKHGSLYYDGERKLPQPLQRWNDLTALLDDHFPSYAAGDEITSVAINPGQVLLCRKNGTVSGIPLQSALAVDVRPWTDIQTVCAGTYHVLGMKRDGTLVLADNSGYGLCNIDKLMNP